MILIKVGISDHTIMDSNITMDVKLQLNINNVIGVYNITPKIINLLYKLHQRNDYSILY
jgi:hypothetical protein